MSGVQVYDVEVDVAVARPPTAANTRTVYCRVAVPLDLPNILADTQAHLDAIAMAVQTRHGRAERSNVHHPASGGRVVMAVGSRITRLVL